MSAHARLRDVAAAVGARLDDVVETMVSRTREEAPDWFESRDPGLDEVCRRSCYDQMRFLLDELAHGRELPSDAPRIAAETAQLAAQTGVKLDVLFQTYRISHAVAWDTLLEEAHRLRRVLARAARR